MLITKQSLPRRTFLRGLGATIGLPLLDGMVPALSAQAKTAAKPVPRLAFFYVSNGVYQFYASLRMGIENTSPIRYTI